MPLETKEVSELTLKTSPITKSVKGKELISFYFFLFDIVMGGKLCTLLVRLCYRGNR